MSKNGRDTQFAGFAKVLLREMHEPIADYWREDCEQIIARRAYDLACHVIRSQAQGMDLLAMHDPEWMKERVEMVPDMPELPKEKDA